MNKKSMFLNAQSLNKVVSFELKPVGKTSHWVGQEGWIKEGEEKDLHKNKVIKIMDDFYRKKIKEGLENADIDWKELFDNLADNSEKAVTQRKEIRKKKRKEIRALFEKDSEFKNFFKAVLLQQLLPDFINTYEGYTDEERIQHLKDIQHFNKFTAVFQKYWTNRSNMFSDEDKSTAIGYRIVHENADIFKDNISAYNKIRKEIPNELETIEKENLKELDSWKLEHIFSASFFEFVLTQKGIDFYNNICGVINQHINLYAQENKILGTPYKMRTLCKQILSESESEFKVPVVFKDDEEVYANINDFMKLVNQSGIKNKCEEMLANKDLYDYSKIYLANKDCNLFSQKIFSNWSIVSEALKKMYDSRLSGSGKTKENKILKAIKDEKFRSLQSMEDVVNEYTEYSICNAGSQYVALLQDILDRCSWDEIESSEPAGLLESEKDREKIKQILDAFMALKDWVQQFLVEELPEKDTYFYALVYDIADVMMKVVPLYNRVHNYATQKPYEDKKVRILFGNPVVGEGWSVSKEYDCNSVLFIRNGQYYVGIFNPHNKPDKKIMNGHPIPNSDTDYKKMEYRLLPEPHKMLPKVALSKKGIENYKPSAEILDGYGQKKHIKSNPKFDIHFCHKLIDYFKFVISKYPGWDRFSFKFSETSTYNDINEFYNEVAVQGYRLDFVYISETQINALVDQGSLYLFQVYSKDFSESSKGTKNLFTLYWEALFDKANLKDVVFKLNGKMEIFYRKSSIKKPVLHEAGSILVDKKYDEIVTELVTREYINDKGEIVTETVTVEKKVKKTIPRKNYLEISAYLNHQRNSLSEESKKWLPKCKYRKTKMEFVKDKRYTVNQFSIHCPITINFGVKDKNINEIALSYIREEEDLHVIGIDRGERNLIYVSVINRDGQIVEQKSFNIVNGFDYKEKLDLMERARQNARKDWKEIEKIKDVKSGYLSQVIHEICKLLLKYNAIIVLEDLNYGFKTGRFKVEKQVYQKFETMLIKKLTYLVDKNLDPTEEGGVLKGYQMSYIPKSVINTGKQCGVMFYVPAAYTSKIDPTTGFADIFAYKEYSSGKDKKEFLLAFDAIYYDKQKDYFVFQFDYDKFSTHKKSFARKQWTACTYGERIHREKDSNNLWKEFVINPTDVLKAVFNSYAYEDGHDLRSDIENLDVRKDLEVIKQLFYTFKLTMQMRNSKTGKDYDRIISPIINASGNCFDSAEHKAGLPVDADANGAYHIALKGLYLANRIKQNENISKKELLKITHEQWFEFMQKQRCC